MKKQTIIEVRLASNLPNDEKEAFMKGSITRYWFGIVVAMVLATLPLSAQQPTPFDIANEVMTYQQSAVLSFIGSTFGADPSSQLNFSTHVDPAGQNFTFSINQGSTYLGQPITLTTSGTLDPFHVWNASSSGTYGGIPFAQDSKYVPPTALGYGLTLKPCYVGCTYQAWFNAVNHIDPCPGCIFTPNIVHYCETHYINTNGPNDQEVCYDIYTLDDSIVPGTFTITYSWTQQNPVSSSWGWNTSNIGPDYWGVVDTTGLSPTDGSDGTSTSLITPLLVSTDTFFTDLGSGPNTYQCCTGWPVSGSGANGGSFTSASQFSPAVSGAVSRIDIGIGYGSGPDLFYAGLLTDNGGRPGAVVARWDNLSSDLPIGLCCGVVTISNVEGLSLSSGTKYWLVLGPTDLSDSSSLTWNANSQGVTGLEDYSTDGGQTWNSNGQQTLGAFDILSQPARTISAANEFTVAVSGSVSQIDVAVAYVSGSNSFYAAIYTENNGVPGTLLARWDSLSSSQSFNDCCGLVSVTGISGLTLTAGQHYFLVLGPESPNSTTLEQWNLNTTEVLGLNLFSLDGGSTWNSRPQQLLGAFDVLGGSDTLYTNLGTGAFVYQCCTGWQLSGSGAGASKSLLSGRTK